MCSSPRTTDGTVKHPQRQSLAREVLAFGLVWMDRFGQRVESGENAFALEVELTSLHRTGTCSYVEERLSTYLQFTQVRPDTFRFVRVRDADQNADRSYADPTHAGRHRNRHSTEPLRQLVEQRLGVLQVFGPAPLESPDNEGLHN